MRRPHVYERSAPRAGTPPPDRPIPQPVITARTISGALPKLIADARAQGLNRLAAALAVAKVEADLAAGIGRVVGAED